MEFCVSPGICLIVTRDVAVCMRLSCSDGFVLLCFVLLVCVFVCLFVALFCFLAYFPCLLFFLFLFLSSGGWVCLVITFVSLACFFFFFFFNPPADGFVLS